MIAHGSGEFSVVAIDIRYDRKRFASGEKALDQYLHEQAGQDARRKVAAIFLLVDNLENIVGYYSLSAYALRAVDFPPEISRKLPRYPVLPATLLGRLAISIPHQGKSLGQYLLLDALHRSWENTAAIGFVGVVVDALNKSAENFYLHHGFLSLLDHPGKLILPMESIGKLF